MLTERTVTEDADWANWCQRMPTKRTEQTYDADWANCWSLLLSMAWHKTCLSCRLRSMACLPTFKTKLSFMGRHNVLLKHNTSWTQPWVEGCKLWVVVLMAFKVFSRAAYVDMWGTLKGHVSIYSIVTLRQKKCKTWRSVMLVVHFLKGPASDIKEMFFVNAMLVMLLGF